MNQPGARDIAVVLGYLDYFQSSDSEFYTVSNELLMDPYFYSDRTTKFITDLYDHHFIQPFDWGRWQGQAVRYFENPDLVARARMSTLIRLLTTHVRKDRFVGGHLAHMIDSGHIVAILMRMRELANRDNR